MSIRFNARTSTIELDATSTLTFPASTTNAASLNIAEGVAPSAPVDGDVWVTAAGEFFARLNGSSVDLAAGGGGGNVTKVGTPVDNQIGVWTGDGTIEGTTTLTYNGTSLVAYGSNTASIIDAQDETAYDNSPTSEGTFAGGTGHAALDVITLSDGSTITVDTVSTGVVTEFTVETPTVTPFTFGTTLTQTGTTGGGSGFTLTPDVDNVNYTVTTHYLGINSTNRIAFEEGTSYCRFQLNDDRTGTEAANMWFDINSSSTGSHSIFFSDGGFGSPVVDWDLTTGQFAFGGGIELTEQADHSGTVIGGRGQIWVKSGTFGGALMYTEGDTDNDFHTLNVNESIFNFDNSTTAADPGAGDIRFDSGTPASVTNLYINDTEDSGRDASYLLANLSVGDIIKIRSMWDAADYWAGRVDAAPTDNTGWWTVPVTTVFSGSLPITGDFLHIDVDWVGTSTSAASSPSTPITYTVQKPSDEIVNNSTTLQNDDHLVLSNLVSGLYRLDMVVLFRDVAVSGCGAKFNFTTTGVGSTNNIVWATNKNFSGAATRAYEEQGVIGDVFDAIGLVTGSGTSRMRITAYFDVTSASGSVQFQWAQNTLQANDLEVETGSWMACTRLGPT